jgi:pre-mRNA-splicing factor 38A
MNFILAGGREIDNVFYSCRYVRCLGAVYLRLVGETLEVYNYLEPLYNDYRKIKRKNRNGGINCNLFSSIVFIIPLSLLPPPRPLSLPPSLLPLLSSCPDFELLHVDEFIDELLRDDRACDIILPRIQKRFLLEQNEQLEPRVSALDDDLSDEEEEEEEEPESDHEKERERERRRSPSLAHRHHNRERDRKRSRSRSPGHRRLVY